MGARISNIREAMVTKEIGMMVRRAANNGGSLFVKESVNRLREGYPTCRRSEMELTEEILIAAALGGVAVEFGRSKAA